MNSDRPTTWILPSYSGRLGSALASFLEDEDLKTSVSWHRQCFVCEKFHKGLNTTNWTELSLVPCRLQKIPRAASQMLKMNRMRRDIFSPGLWRMSSKNAQELPRPAQSNVRCFVSETKNWSKEEVQSRRRQNLVLQRTSWHNYARQHDERDVKASRHRAASHKPLPQSRICYSALQPYLRDEAHQIHNRSQVRPGSWALQRAAFDGATTEDVTRSQWFHWKCVFWWCNFSAGKRKRSSAAVQTNPWIISTSGARESCSCRK